MAISNDSIQKLLPLLRPYLRNESERRAYLIRALGTNADALNLIWNEPVNTFSARQYGRLASPILFWLQPGKAGVCFVFLFSRTENCELYLLGNN